MLPSVFRIVSYLFHPLLYPFYLTLLLLFKDSFISLIVPLKLKIILLSFIFLMTFFLPALLIYILSYYKIGNVKNLLMIDKEERPIPYIITAIGFYSSYLFIRQIHLPLTEILNIFLIGSSILILLTLLINTRWKISAHMVGIGGLTAMVIIMHLLLFTLPFQLYAIIIIAGLLGTARLYLHAHSPAQVYIGFLLGFCGMYGFFLLSV